MSILDTVRGLLVRKRIDHDYVKATAENALVDAQHIEQRLNGIAAGNDRVRAKAIELKRRVRENRNKIEETINALKYGER